MTMRTLPQSWLSLGAIAASALVLSACTSTSLTRAPVEDRSRGTVSSTPAPTRPLIGQQNKGKPGFYEVQKGDTLYRLSRNYGRTIAELAYWNGLSDPYLLEIGDVLRVAPEGSAATPVASTQPVPAVTTPSPTGAASSIALAWPATGPILQHFDASKNKGIDIAGKAGDPVMAAADGKVMYAGNALRGYGNLIIVQHNATFVTAYAHNQRILVQEGQSVTRGQKIAEMGQTEADRVKLHFELRRNQTPINPMAHLPGR